MDKFTVVGVRKGVTKQAKPFTVIHVLSDFDDYMLQHGCDGQMAQNIYIGKYVDVCIGDVVSAVYGVGFGGKAIVTDIEKVG